MGYLSSNILVQNRCISRLYWIIEYIFVTLRLDFVHNTNDECECDKK